MTEFIKSVLNNKPQNQKEYWTIRININWLQVVLMIVTLISVFLVHSR